MTEDEIVTLPPTDSQAAATDDWLELSFSQAVQVNPATLLQRGKTYPFVDMAAVNTDSRNAYPSEIRLFKGSGSRFQHGDTLMARITPCLENGKIARYSASDGIKEAHGSTEFIIIRGRDGVTDNDFAYYLTQWEEVRNYAIGQMTGTSGRQRVPVDSLNHLIVPIPSLTEQRAIAHALGTLDDKIELNRRMNRTLEEMARAIFKDWFVDFGPTKAKMEGQEPYLPPELWGLFPDELVDSELGEVPDGWKGGVFSDSVEILSGGTPRTSVPEYWGGNVPWYTPKDAPDLSDIFVLTTERSITMAGVANSSTQVLPVGTTVISARGTVGRLACLGLPMAMNQTCYGIRGASGYPDYFTYWNVRNTVQDLQARTHGTVFDTITRDTFKIAESILAPPQLAQAYEECVYPLMARILGNAFESFRLTGLRDTLLPSLISGEMNSGDPQN